MGVRLRQRQDDRSPPTLDHHAGFGIGSEFGIDFGAPGSLVNGSSIRRKAIQVSRTTDGDTS